MKTSGPFAVGVALLAAVLPASIVSHNRRLDEYLRNRDPPMTVKKWKLLLKVPAIGIIGAFGFYSISQGGDPTVIGGFTLSLIAYLAGVDVAELAAIRGGNDDE